MAAKKEHKAQLIVGNVRYVAIERDGKVSFSKDGEDAGSAKWRDDHFAESTSMMPDNVITSLEAKIKELTDADYYD